MITAKIKNCDVFNYFEKNTELQLKQLKLKLKQSIKTKNTLSKILSNNTIELDIATTGDLGPFDWVMFSLKESSHNTSVYLIVLTKQLEQFYKLEDLSDSDIIEPCHIIVKQSVTKNEAVKALTQWIKQNFNKTPKIVIKE